MKCECFLFVLTVLTLCNDFIDIGTVLLLLLFFTIRARFSCLLTLFHFWIDLLSLICELTCSDMFKLFGNSWEMVGNIRFVPKW